MISIQQRPHSITKTIPPGPYTLFQQRPPAGANPTRKKARFAAIDVSDTAFLSLTCSRNRSTVPLQSQPVFPRFPATQARRNALTVSFGIGSWPAIVRMSFRIARALVLDQQSLAGLVRGGLKFLSKPERCPTV
jgi:hypothetical protein